MMGMGLSLWAPYTVWLLRYMIPLTRARRLSLSRFSSPREVVFLNGLSFRRIAPFLKVEGEMNHGIHRVPLECRRQRLAHVQPVGADVVERFGEGLEVYGYQLVQGIHGL